MRTLPVLAALLLASCGRDRCEVELRSVVPLVGSDDVPLGTSIVFELDRARGDETVTLTLDGDPVPGVTTVDGDRVIFAPDEPLAPDTRYEAELSGGCGHFTAFTTGRRMDGKIHWGLLRRLFFAGVGTRGGPHARGFHRYPSFAGSGSGRPGGRERLRRSPEPGPPPKPRPRWGKAPGGSRRELSAASC